MNNDALKKALTGSIPMGAHPEPHAEWIAVRLDFVQAAIALIDQYPKDPYAELKAAAVDPTKQIRLGTNPWRDSGEWSFLYPPDQYEIRDKPKPLKKVKLLAWFDGNALFWRTEKFRYDGNTRVPSEDKEIEVEE